MRQGGRNHRIGLIVRGSDHLTAYNVYAEGFNSAGYVGEVYGLSRRLFDPERIAIWAERRGVLVKALEEKATGSIDIAEFVPLAAIDPVYFDRPYYLGPEKGGDKAYLLLAEAMRVLGFTVRGKRIVEAIQRAIILERGG